MEGIKITFLEKAVAWITSGAALELAKLLVLQLMDADMTGEEKRAKVQGLLKEHLTGFSTVLINILIEVAVLVIRSKLNSGSIPSAGMVPTPGNIA